MIHVIQNQQVECSDESIWDVGIHSADLFVCRGKLYTCRKIQYEQGAAFVFVEETHKVFDADCCFKVIAIDGEPL